MMGPAASVTHWRWRERPSFTFPHEAQTGVSYPHRTAGLEAVNLYQWPRRRPFIESADTGNEEAARQAGKRSR
ncbi:hypothetical protein XELAEV_18004536mg [Xenopus laevis]|uniref:Uncharacterized protein n=1 Tax=Xenopus laevis TaxID=8355 RepID=A0A974BPC2_XENLA|nr:hypothetical protein XELAEV_18004536mg [Xenopus laevis]